MNDRETEASRSTDPVRHTAMGWLFVFCSMTMLGCLVSCYWGRFDYCAAITIFPAWVWLVPGFVLAGLACRLVGCRVGIVMTLLWVAFFLAFVDTPTSLLRGLVKRAPFPGDAKRPDTGDSIRVVTLNCASHAEAALETLAYHPDIVLLQESPSERDVVALSKQLYGPHGNSLWKGDASLVSRGHITPIEVPAALRGICACARVHFDSGDEVVVISFHLVPSPLRLDLWSPACWRAYTKNRKKRRIQLRAIVNMVESMPSDSPIILGGDFNAPPGDAVFRMLRPRLVDTFQRAGVGWGNSFENDYPFHRIDQVWIGGPLKATVVCSKKTAHSDHRMVICDLASGCDEE